MQKYEKPEFEIIVFEADDIIRTSDTDTEDDDISKTGSMFNLF